MSWKPPKRTLQNVTKVKLGNGCPLPENVDDETPVKEFTSVAQKHLQFRRNESTVFSEFNSSLPVASQIFEDDYLDRFDKTSEYDQEEDSDLEHIFSEYEGTDGSSLDDSNASYFSWTDDVGFQDKTKNKELFEDLEMALYDDDPTLVHDEELSIECGAWKSTYIYLRVLGKKPSYTQEISEHFSELENESGEDVDGEILAIHGFLSESPKHKALAGNGSKHNLSHGGNLIEKVKAAALDQLSCYALSEALQSFEREQLERQVAVRKKPCQIDDAASALANLSEDLGRALQISGRSIYRSAKVSNLGNEKNVSIGSELVHLGVQSKRLFSSINVIPEDKSCITSNTSFSVFGIPKPLNLEICSRKTRILEKRGYHSAADRKRPGILDRRFSCVSPEHDKLLKPSHGDEECESSSPESSSGKLISAPNTPLKLLRRLTLPPIQNLNSLKLSADSAEKSPSSLSHIKQIFVKNKVALSPIPTAVNVSGRGMTELQLAKKLLDSTPDSGHWSSYQKSGFSGIQNMKSRKKNIDKSVYNPCD